ncbi:MAG TPA: Rieske 2Fe-2S domain-containing protein, partial [Jatrophihabitans sp.]|nr:Rieske 2Fe-2S domain-containing protein [Jatrophihabitans sp.]
QAKLGWAHPELDLLAEITEWFTPLLVEADRIAEGINGGVRFTAADSQRGDVDFILDFVTREVRPYAGEKVRYRFQTQRVYLEQLVHQHEIDWVNSLFLSCRFTATRVGPYNEYVYTFFKCLSEERLNYAEGWFAEAAHDDETITIDGWAFQRRCPHLKADLARFGQIEGNVLTCQMHGWKWNLESGRCISSVGRPLRTEGRVSG